MFSVELMSGHIHGSGHINLDDAQSVLTRTKDRAVRDRDGPNGPSQPVVPKWKNGPTLPVTGHQATGCARGVAEPFDRVAESPGLRSPSEKLTHDNLVIAHHRHDFGRRWLRDLPGSRLSLEWERTPCVRSVSSWTKEASITQRSPGRSRIGRPSTAWRS